MVTVSGYAKRKSENGKEFNVLLLQGEVEFVASKTTGRFYATARSCSVTCTFNDTICEGLIGKKIPGAIEKMECAPYDFTVKETGEVIKLDYTYYYCPNPKTTEAAIFQEKVAA